MKRCPSCQRMFDDSQSFCIEDGAILLSDSQAITEGPGSGRYEPPPTELYTPPTPTRGMAPPDTGNVYAPPSQPGYGPGPGSWQSPAYPPANYAPPSPLTPAYPYPASPQLDQTLAIAALVCGAVSVIFMCFGAILGVPAIVLGIMARNRIKNDPARYGGNGLATAGLVCGLVSTGFTLLYFVIMIIGTLAK